MLQSKMVKNRREGDRREFLRNVGQRWLGTAGQDLYIVGIGGALCLCVGYIFIEASLQKNVSFVDLVSKLLR
jgi:hypothetical protein